MRLLLTTGAPTMQREFDKLKGEVERLTLDNAQLRRQLEAAGVRPPVAVTNVAGKASATPADPTRLVNRPVVSANVSSPAFFRAIQELKPTLMIDEADRFLKSKKDLQGILNAGYSRDTAYVLRMGQPVPGSQSNGQSSNLAFFLVLSSKVLYFFFLSCTFSFCAKKTWSACADAIRAWRDWQAPADMPAPDSKRLAAVDALLAKAPGKTVSRSEWSF